MLELAKFVVGAVTVFMVAYTFYKIGYDSGYFDAVKEHLDKLSRRTSKNWSKCLAKYAEKQKETDDGKNRSCSSDGSYDGVGGDRSQQESAGQDRVR